MRIGAAPENLNSFAGVVTRDRFLGSFRRFDFRYAEVTLLGETSEAGEIAAIHIPPNSVQILPDRTNAST